jgi:hypothetical protein
MATRSPGAGATAGRNILEMLPLQTLGDAADSTLAHAVTADLSNALGGVDGLRLVPAPDPLILVPLDTTRPMPWMRMAGTVQREGDLMRVNLRLSQISNDSTLWTGRFDGKRSGLLALENDIAAGASDGVRRQLPPP